VGLLAEWTHYGPHNPWLIAVCIGLGLFSVSATIDAARKPRWAFTRAHRLKWFWVLVPLSGGGMFPALFGFVAALLWWKAVRFDVVREVARAPIAS
jgi:hypothetical protein